MADKDQANLAKFVGVPGAIAKLIASLPNTLQHQPHRFARHCHKNFNAADVY